QALEALPPVSAVTETPLSEGDPEPVSAEAQLPGPGAPDVESPDTQAPETDAEQPSPPSETEELPE
ncbi:MAG: hypothetical protein AAFY82_02890, partial [Pseudomonadota bacterium]